MHFPHFVTLVGFMLLVPSFATAQPVDPDCNVTSNADGEEGSPQYPVPGTLGDREGSLDGMYGSQGLWIRLPEDGIYRPDIPGWIHADGSVDWGKTGIYRDDEAAGTIDIHGHLTDEQSAMLTAYIPDGYGETGFQVAGIMFPDVGCWNITIASGSATLEFTMWVTREVIDAAA